MHYFTFVPLNLTEKTRSQSHRESNETHKIFPYTTSHSALFSVLSYFCPMTAPWQTDMKPGCTYSIELPRAFKSMPQY